MVGAAQPPADGWERLMPRGASLGVARIIRTLRGTDDLAA
jgi:hypothetical protein